VKVTDVRCVVVPREKLPAGSVAMDLVIVRVLTDEGIEGNCFAWGGNHGEATAQLIDALVKPPEIDRAGYVHAPRRAGLGVEIDWKAIDALG